MSQHFDPYHKWLGIPPEERPVCHYRLLGIPLYEPDQEVIAGAAVQRMNWLRKFQTGEHGADAQRLTKEIADAWACLMNPGRKQQYDEELRSQYAGLRNAIDETFSHPSQTGIDLTAGEPLPPFLAVAPTPAPPSINIPAPPVVSAPPSFTPATYQSYERPVAEPPVASPVVIRTRGRGIRSRYQRRPSFVGSLIKQVTASFLGLALGYFILCNIRPEYDVFHLFTRAANPPVAEKVKTESSKPKPHYVVPPRQQPRQPNLRPKQPISKPKGGNSGTPRIATPPQTQPPTESGPRPPVESQPPSRFKVPNDEEQERAATLIRETYKSVFDAPESQDEKAARAGKILKDALETADPNVQFVGLRTAQELSLEIGEVVAALEISMAIANRFEVDSLEDQLAILSKLNFDAAVLDRMQDIASFLDPRWDDALNEDRYDLAAKLSEFFARAHKSVIEINSPAKDPSAGSPTVPFDPRRDEKLAELFTEAANAFDALSKNREDEKANTVAGRLLCFVLNNWEAGVLRLAKGEPAELREIATADIATPKTSIQQLEVADRWLKYTASDQVNAEAIRHRALDWYRAALPQLTGIYKTRAESRIAEIESLSVQALDQEETPDETTPSPEGLPKTARELERIASEMRSAKEALALYQQFLEDKSIPDSEKELANRKFSHWAKLAADDYRRLGTKWVPASEYEQAKREAIESTSRALMVLHSEPKECLRLLEKASRLDADTDQPDFVLGVLHAVVGHDPRKAQIYFQKCVSRKPQNSSALNNLAITKALTSRHTAAMNWFRTAANSVTDPSLVGQNIRRASVLSNSKAWAVTPAATDAYNKLTEMIPPSSPGKRGWLYLLPPVEGKEIPYDQLLRGRHPLLQVGDGFVEDRACVSCMGSGQLTCGACNRGRVSRRIQVPIGKTGDGNIHYKTNVVYEDCTDCGGDGRLDCPRCTGGIESGFPSPIN